MNMRTTKKRIEKELSVALSHEGWAALTDLSATRNQTYSDVVETLILREFRRYERRRNQAR